jgi:4-aminobutyrate aminotransferase
MEHLIEEQKIFKREGDINLSDERKSWQDKNLDKKTQNLLEEDSKYFIHQALSTPCLNALESCDGIYIQDTQGKKYMDFHGNSAHQIGFKNNFVINRIIEQLQKLPFSPRRYTNETAINLAKKLCDLAPDPLCKVLFTTGGASSNSTAIKLARALTGRHKILSMWDSFHGATLDTISVGGESSFRYNAGPLLPGVEHVPPPASFRGVWCNGKGENNYDKVLEYIDYVFEREGDFAAIITETIRNTVVQIPSQEYYQSLRKICDKHGVLLILDEIPISLGRTGKLFAFENFGIVPDIVTLGKGLGGGVVPFSAVLTDKRFDSFPEKSVGHFTHEKSPLGTSAAMATLEFIEKENLLLRVSDMEEYMRGRLMHMKEKFECIGDIRGIGLLWGIDVVKDKTSIEPDSQFTEKVMYDCLTKGLSFKVGGGNTILLSPPLVIEKKQIDQALDILESAFSNVK